MRFSNSFEVSKLIIRSVFAATILLAGSMTAMAEPAPAAIDKDLQTTQKAGEDAATNKPVERKPAAASKTGDADSSAKSADAKPEPEQGPLPELFELAAELQAMVDEDQKARTELIQKMAPQPAKNSEEAKSDVAAAVEAVKSIDSKNTLRLQAIVAEHGWPEISKVGKTGSGNMWLLVQHADQQLEFQKKCLELMTPLLDRQEVSRQNYAYLVDRVLVNSGKPQRYGTQINMKGTEFVPAEVESPDDLDARRKKMDLIPMAEYLKQIKAAYGDTAKAAAPATEKPAGEKPAGGEPAPK